MKYKGRILLFDGICNLCNAIVYFVIKRDSRSIIKFAAIQSEKGQLLSKALGIEADKIDSVVYIKNNFVFYKSTAALELLKDLGKIWSLFYIFIFIPKPIRDFMYDIIAKWRYRIFGKRNNCMMPSDEIKQRFIVE
jgi:predicted DCC family thiol-disulfide oxidoreductase YuxK